MRDAIRNEYYKWLSDIVCKGRFSKNISYNKLLMLLHDTKFKPLLPRDRNRADDGVDLRYRFAMTNGYENKYEIVLDYLNGRCSVLEMLVALSVRCEETIMDDPDYGDRTGQWFWGMINSLGLGHMSDTIFDKDYATDAITKFLKREYEPDGRGGLFTIKESTVDLREMEIWSQLCMYLDSFL